MCTYSMIADDWSKRMTPIIPDIVRPDSTYPDTPYFVPAVDVEEFERLKKEVQSLKKLLKAAKIYDKETGQEGCESADKIKMLKDLADALGVDMEEAFPDV